MPQVIYVRAIATYRRLLHTALYCSGALVLHKPRLMEHGFIKLGRAHTCKPVLLEKRVNPTGLMLMTRIYCFIEVAYQIHINSSKVSF